MPCACSGRRGVSKKRKKRKIVVGELDTSLAAAQAIREKFIAQSGETTPQAGQLVATKNAN